jgi:sulfate adenylyltransferase
MSITLSSRELSDLECLLDGSFAPLTGFMNQTDYDSVVETCHLANGALWSLPVVLQITESQKNELEATGALELLLRDETSLPVAKLTEFQIYLPNLYKECRNIYGTLDTNHPTVGRLMKPAKLTYYLGGQVTTMNPIQHYDFVKSRLTPSAVKAQFKERGWTTIVGFQTRNPLHRSHVELTRLGMKLAGADAKLLLHPVVGDTQECDIDYFTRCLCYEKICQYYPEGSMMLALLPYSMRMGGPREALQHAIIRKTYGCTHFIVGRDHAGPSYKTQSGQSFYGTYQAQEFVKGFESELGLTILCLPNVQYVEGLGYLREDEIPTECQSQIKNISGTAMRSLLMSGQPIPDWYTYPEISEILHKSVKNQTTGLCIYLIGLSGSGKSTLANALRSHLMETECRPITILDGDAVRLNLSKGLGFSKADRSTNVRRIGYVASEIVKHGGLVICANIAPYDDDRLFNRELISQYGRYVEVFVDTSLATCEQRDVKGLYKLAREGKMKGMTGIDDPFEVPTQSTLTLSDGSLTLRQQLDKILAVI